jgi:hypothetical protein
VFDEAVQANVRKRTSDHRVRRQLWRNSHNQIDVELARFPAYMRLAPTLTLLRQQSRSFGDN